MFLDRTSLSRLSLRRSSEAQQNAVANSVAWEYPYPLATVVEDFRVAEAPNPRCCPNPQHLCANCMAKALRQTGYIGNRKATVQNAAKHDEDDEPLIPPTIDWAAEAAHQPQPKASREAADQDDPDMLVPPAIDWKEWARSRDR